MLLRKSVLEGISRGDIDLVFRRWVRPTVKSGGTLRTQLGLLQIESVEPVQLAAITKVDARRAGTDLVDLIGFLEAKVDGDVYRVKLGAIVPDPRVVLREDDQLTADDVVAISSRLDRLDRSSSHGPWTLQFLRLLADHPHVRAQDLADDLGLEKIVFKNDVRKLKEIGLTISHSPGYELSPRGIAYLSHSQGPG